MSWRFYVNNTSVFVPHMDILKILLGLSVIHIVYGHGMSENSPLISVNTPRHKRNVSVGLPVSYTEVKIIEPNAEGIGEIACKSSSVMLGYYDNEEATKEVITEDGWLLTEILAAAMKTATFTSRDERKTLS